VIHAAEGTDETANHEVRILANAGALSASTILVHGVAIGPSDVPLLKRGNTSLVWCPTSNHFTMHRTIDSAVLNSGIPIALGSDSAISAAGDLLDELRFAARTVGADRVYEMVTSRPARMLKLPEGFGRICEGGPADLLIIRDSGRTPAMSLLENTSEMVIAGGRVQLVSKGLARLCPASVLNQLEPIEVEGRGTYLIAGDISSLLSETKAALQAPPRLAGKAVAA
jgi:cytosine/adenosine deaminase-related metal-dependent hydrolase